MRKNMNVIVLGAWVVTFIAAYVGLGGYLWELLVGTDRTMIPVTPLVLVATLLVTSLTLTVMWAKNLGFGQAIDAQPTGRRKFLMGSAAVTGGIVGAGVVTYAKMSPWQPVATDVFFADVEKTAPANNPAWIGSQIVHKRPLGRTGFMVSDISIGTTQFLRHSDPEGLLREVLDRGVNYIDTSPDYGGSKSETAIGNVLAERNREELFVVTKWCTADGHVRQGSSPETYLAALDDSLSRLQTDYVDLVHVHSCDTVERLLDPNMLEAFEMAKAQGKARFLGVSTHTPNLEEVAYAAIESDKFDVMMLAYHHGAWPKQQDIIKKAAEKNIGIVAMKTLKGAKHKGMMEFQNEETSYTQASFKWVMSDPSVSCLVVSYFDTQHVDEYIHASGQPLNGNDVAVLNKYDDLIAGTHCFASCGDCLSTCPSALPINDVLRHRMYFEDYGDEKQAMQLYSALEKNADACLNCAAPCEGACPEGINIRERMIGAHEKLVLV
jgi:predicted aldo/keto reductase-like oxidoreductase